MKKHFLYAAALALFATIAVAILSARQNFQDLKTSLLHIKAPEQFASEPLAETNFNRENRKNLICFSIERQTQNISKMEVRAGNISEKLLGVAFDLKFNPRTMKFLKYEKGDFFERGGKPFYLVKISNAASNVIAGISLKRGDFLQNGSGAIIYLYFQRIKNANPDTDMDLNIGNADSKFAFMRSIAATIENGNRKNLSNIQWDSCNPQFLIK